jgi:hypothetical protein
MTYRIVRSHEILSELLLTSLRELVFYRLHGSIDERVGFRQGLAGVVWAREIGENNGALSRGLESSTELTNLLLQKLLACGFS